MKVKKIKCTIEQTRIQIKTATVYLAPRGDLLVFYKTENETVKETVTDPLEILLPNMLLP